MAKYQVIFNLYCRAGEMLVREWQGEAKNAGQARAQAIEALKSGTGDIYYGPEDQLQKFEEIPYHAGDAFPAEVQGINRYYNPKYAISQVQAL